jgi:hypothetical protein
VIEGVPAVAGAGGAAGGGSPTGIRPVGAGAGVAPTAWAFGFGPVVETTAVPGRGGAGGAAPATGAAGGSGGDPGGGVLFRPQWKIRVVTALTWAPFLLVARLGVPNSATVIISPVSRLWTW